MLKTVLCAFALLFLLGCVSQDVKLGEEFTLRENQSITIAPDGLGVKVTDFIYSPCPVGAVCIWSGLGIGLEYRLNNQTESGVNLLSAFGYQTEIVDTDYQTYARLRVTKPG
jgi:hypothetical protein